MTKHVTLLAFAAIVASCAHTIEGTEIVDTDENRAVLSVINALQAAMENRDVDGILKLISTRYFEDMGTPDPKDDYGYEELRTDILPRSMEHTKELYVTFTVHEIQVEGDRAHADVRYASRAKLDFPAGTLWDTHKEFNRVELANENGAWKIVSGL